MEHEFSLTIIIRNVITKTMHELKLRRIYFNTSVYGLCVTTQKGLSLWRLSEGFATESFQLRLSEVFIKSLNKFSGMCNNQALTQHHLEQLPSHFSELNIFAPTTDASILYSSYIPKNKTSPKTKLNRFFCQHLNCVRDIRTWFEFLTALLFSSFSRRHRIALQRR